MRSLGSLQQACTLEAELALLLRVSYKYGKTGVQELFSMGVLEHMASCRAFSVQVNVSLSMLLCYALYLDLTSI